MNVQALLEQRNREKQKKPRFIRQDYQKAIRLKAHWHAPQGGHSKMRLKLRGNRRQPSIGFSSPQAVRSLTRQGHKVILISTVAQLASIAEPVTIASSVGLKKRVEIAKAAKEKKLKILNMKDIDTFIAGAEAALKVRREAKKQKLTKKEKAKAERVKKAEEKAKKEKAKEETPEEKEKREHEEKRKVLEQQAP